MPILPVDTIFGEIAILLLIAAAMGALSVWLRQPLILGYIFVGILAGPSMLGLVTARDQVDLLARMGIAMLLFVVGLKLDLHLIRTLGPVALATGLGQIFFTSIIGYFLSLALRLTPVVALYVAVALTFSSTIIIVKLLSDKREIDMLHGRIAVGFLIVQDIVAILVMIGLSAFGMARTSDDLVRAFLFLSLKGVALLAGIGFLMRYILPWLLHHLARSLELLVLFSIAWAVFFALLGDFLGFSKEVGAFLAGVSLASTRYREAIGARLVSLRDFLLLFFFIDLGAQLEIGLLGTQIGPAIALSLFVLIGNPLIVIIIMGVMGYRRRTGFLAGLTVAQISEFSLILGALGVSIGHIGKETLGLITLVGLITIGLSTYLILYSHSLYRPLSWWLRFFERRVPYREKGEEKLEIDSPVDIILFGLGRFGGNLAQNLRQRGLNVLGVDFNSKIVAEWNKKGLHTLYGDAEDPEFPSALPLYKANWIVSTIPQREVNLNLLDALHHYGYGGQKAVTAHNSRDAEILKESGADLILFPFADAAKEAAELLGTGKESTELKG
ncbi:MAG: cation:proton antiporter [Syntrophaceae bacterium]|nr:cation:proton antiporter [Syntrophaceae bacterium]